MYKSRQVASRLLGVWSSDITRCCQQKRSQAGGYEFEWAEPTEPDIMEDEEWRDGSKLERELHHANWLEGLISSTGFKPSAAVAADVKATTAAAKAARESMKGMAKYKAMQIVLLGRSAFPWVASQGLVGALATACGACTTYYRAVALEAFKDSASGASGWRTFGSL